MRVQNVLMQTKPAAAEQHKSIVDAGGSDTYAPRITAVPIRYPNGSLQSDIPASSVCFAAHPEAAPSTWNLLLQTGSHRQHL
jgi:hypothetical protein